jgi:hypothetical protein
MKFRFLLARLYLDSLQDKNKTSVMEIEDALGKLPKGDLEEACRQAYDEATGKKKRIKGQ